MLNRYTLPFISALVVSASLASCQRQAEEASSPSGEIVFTVVSPSQTKSSAAETSPVSIPVKSDGGESLVLEVSSRPWPVEESSAPATKVVPSDGSYFSTNHHSFGVMTYRASSEGAAAADRTLIWRDEAVYNDGIWAPSTSRAWPFSGNYLTFFGWAPYDEVTPSDNSGAPVISDFTVETDAANQVDLLVFGNVESTDSPLVSAIRVPVTFGHALTAVKFVEDKLTINSVTISGIYDKGSYNMDTGEWADRSPLGQTYSLSSNVTGASSTLMFIPQTLPASATITAQTPAGTITVSLAGQVWEAGTVVTYKLIDPVISFSVSPSLRVKFSPGNLQAVFKGAGTSFTWRFARNQWEYVANGAANTSINGNGKVSAAGTVDLFGWSTSTTMYGIHNSESSSDYSGGFRDWGGAVASTLGSGWRTLSSAEWTYLLNSRNQTYRYCKATVNGWAGLVIFPDYYSHPSGVTAPASVNTSSAGYNSNSWFGDPWTMMESTGCVFLPAAGRRTGSEVYDNGDTGHYFSSTPDGTTNAYRLYFTNAGVDPSYSNYRSLGRSVRLVRNL